MTNSSSPSLPDIRENECHNGWISTRNRLPKDMQECLINYIYDVECLSEVEAVKYREADKTFHYGLVHKLTVEEGITHWKPIRRPNETSPAADKIRAEQTRLEAALDNAFKHNASQKTIDACEYKIVGLIFALEAMEE